MPSVSYAPKQHNSSGMFGQDVEMMLSLSINRPWCYSFLSLNSTHCECLYTWYRLISTQVELIRVSWSLDIFLGLMLGKSAAGKAWCERLLRSILVGPGRSLEKSRLQRFIRSLCFQHFLRKILQEFLWETTHLGLLMSALGLHGIFLNALETFSTTAESYGMLIRFISSLVIFRQTPKDERNREEN